mgnify:CR=1 FL=1
MPQQYVDPRVKDRATLDAMPTKIRRLLLSRLINLKDEGLLERYEYPSVDALQDDLQLISRATK